MITPVDYTNVLLVKELLQELKTTDPRKTRIFKLVYEGLTSHEIAKRLGLSPNTVKALWKQTKELLVQRLESGPVSPYSEASLLQAPLYPVTNPPSNGRRFERTKTPWTEVGENFVPGLEILRGAIAPTYRERLVLRIHSDGRWEQDFSRWRQCYGYKYDYDNDALFREGDTTLPSWVLEVATFVRDHKWMNTLAGQVTIQKYGRSSSIGSHVDSRRCFPGEIVTISLVSRATLRMTHKRNRARLTTVLEPGDVVILRGDARNLWKHEILKRNPVADEDATSWSRLSITLRNVNLERVRQ